MKKLTLTAFLVFCGSIQIQAQVNLFSSTPYTVYYGVIEGGDLKYEQVKGTPYINESFQEAISLNDSISYLIRYDAYKQVMQITEKTSLGQIKVLSPQQSYRFDLVNNNQSYISVTYPSLEKGFGLVIWSNEEGVELIKRQVITFQKGRKGNGGYQLAIPDTFNKVKDSYFIRLKQNGEWIEIPSSKQDFFDFLGADIKKKAKENKLNPSNEEDLIKLIRLRYE